MKMKLRGLKPSISLKQRVSSPLRGRSGRISSVHDKIGTVFINGRINATWHVANKMPKNPSLDQRVIWHVEHAKNCACRPLGGKILKEIKKRGIKI